MRKKAKKDQIERAKAMGQTIGIGEDEGGSLAYEGGRPKRQLSQREIKIKKYAEQFHDYFMKQRKNVGVDKALENSDSEMDEHLEKQVDDMIDARQKVDN